MHPKPQEPLAERSQQQVALNLENSFSALTIATTESKQKKPNAKVSQKVNQPEKKNTNKKISCSSSSSSSSVSTSSSPTKKKSESKISLKKKPKSKTSLSKDSSSSSKSKSNIHSIKLDLSKDLGIQKRLLVPEHLLLTDKGQITLERIAVELGFGKKYRKVVVVAGAGISTASGIPDFRTKDNGLYSKLEKFNLPDPALIFDIDFFKKRPEPFLGLCKDLIPANRNYKPNICHLFFKLLEDMGVLHRIYTQNIDSLERAAGVSVKKIVEAHGSFHSAHCIRCQQEHDVGAVKEAIEKGKTPVCMEMNSERSGSGDATAEGCNNKNYGEMMSGKKKGLGVNHNKKTAKNFSCKGLVKPGIVFFGEDLPDRFTSLCEDDMKQCDLLLIMGTSLVVQPCSGLVNMVRKSTPRVLINRECVGPFVRTCEKVNYHRPGDVKKNTAPHCLASRGEVDRKLDVCRLGDLSLELETFIDMMGKKDILHRLKQEAAHV
eukprot:Nk52_evm19s355 gene=Nk52_evmTU19s355